MIMWSSFFALLGVLAGAPLARTPCDLLPEAQVHGQITLRAIYLSGYYYAAILYDPACSTRDAYFEAICDANVEDFILIDSQSKKNDMTRAEVLVRGKVVPWDGFGHGGTAHRFEIYQVLEVRTVHESIPWPNDNGTKPAPISEAVKALRAIDRQINGALISGSVETLGDLLAADFVHYPTRTNAEDFLKDVRPLCDNNKRWWHGPPRVFARKFVAYTQGAYGCGSGSAEGTTVALSDVYSHVYVRVGEHWRLAIRESLAR